jgi:hypothetical protein
MVVADKAAIYIPGKMVYGIGALHTVVEGLDARYAIQTICLEKGGRLLPNADGFGQGEGIDTPYGALYDQGNIVLSFIGISMGRAFGIGILVIAKQPFVGLYTESSGGQVGELDRSVGEATEWPVDGEQGACRIDHHRVFGL